MPKVSLLVPVYKCERFVQRCSESLFTQSFDDIEFIFYDDCSPDNSIDILRQCIKKYPHRREQIKIISSTANLGVSVARNILLQEATGEFIWYIDSDDWIESDAVKLLYEAASSANADVVTFNFYCENKTRQTVRKFKYSSVETCLQDLIGNNWGVVWRFFMKRTLAITNNITFPVGYKGGEDYVFCVSYFINVQAFTSIDKVLYHYVTYNNNSLITTKDIYSLLHQYLATLEVENILVKSKLYPKYCNAFDLRKAYIITLYKSYFYTQWGHLKFALMRMSILYYRQKFVNYWNFLRR